MAAYHRPTHLILGLVVDTAAYIAEVVRFGIQDGRRAVHWAFTLVRSCAASPQALPRNHSAADRPVPQPDQEQFSRVAIGFQDVVSIANTTLNQTGQAIEGIAYSWRST